MHVKFIVDVSSDRGGVWQVMRVLEIVLPGEANDLSGERVYL